MEPESGSAKIVQHFGSQIGEVPREALVHQVYRVIEVVGHAFEFFVSREPLTHGNVDRRCRLALSELSAEQALMNQPCDMASDEAGSAIAWHLTKQ